MRQRADGAREAGKSNVACCGKDAAVSRWLIGDYLPCNPPEDRPESGREQDEAYDRWKDERIYRWADGSWHEEPEKKALTP